MRVTGYQTMKDTLLFACLEVWGFFVCGLVLFLRPSSFIYCFSCIHPSSKVLHATIHVYVKSFLCRQHTHKKLILVVVLQWDTAAEHTWQGNVKETFHSFHNNAWNCRILILFKPKTKDLELLKKEFLGFVILSWLCLKGTTCCDLESKQAVKKVTQLCANKQLLKPHKWQGAESDWNKVAETMFILTQASNDKGFFFFLFSPFSVLGWTDSDAFLEGAECPENSLVYEKVRALWK